jgi:ATP-dependent RNA helicase UAP56/SUB2
LKEAKEEPNDGGGLNKVSYVAVHASRFRDFLLKPVLLRAIVEYGFGHPSEVQHECIQQVIRVTDILCRALQQIGASGKP